MFPCRCMFVCCLLVWAEAHRIMLVHAYLFEYYLEVSCCEINWIIAYHSIRTNSGCMISFELPRKYKMVITVFSSTWGFLGQQMFGFRHSYWNFGAESLAQDVPLAILFVVACFWHRPSYFDTFVFELNYGPIEIHFTIELFLE